VKISTLREKLMLEIKRNPQAGPKPISIEEYRRRQQLKKEEELIRRSVGTTAKIEPLRGIIGKNQQIKRKRGGVQVRLKRVIARLHETLATTKEEDQRSKLLEELKGYKEALHIKITHKNESHELQKKAKYLVQNIFLFFPLNINFRYIDKQINIFPPVKCFFQGGRNVRVRL